MLRRGHVIGHRREGQPAVHAIMVMFDQPVTDVNAELAVVRDAAIEGRWDTLDECLDANVTDEAVRAAARRLMKDGFFEGLRLHEGSDLLVEMLPIEVPS